MSNTSQRQKVMALVRRPVRSSTHSIGLPTLSRKLPLPSRKRGRRVCPEVAASLFEYLKSQRVLVRYFSSHPLTCSFIRVSVGTDAEMKVF